MEAEERRVLMAAALDGESVPRLAAALGVTVGTVASRLRRAREVRGDSVTMSISRINRWRTNVTPCKPGAARGRTLAGK
jgi:hypothetical protein